MATAQPSPSIDTILANPPDSPESWVLGSSPRITQIARHAEKAAEVQCTVLITGETGTGKEIWARALHKLSARKNKPLVPVNCAALTPTLAESQLFGHEKGAFTGASGQSAGVFRAAEGGIVFLDEVGEMPPELQPKLLRVLQEAEVTPVGASRPVHVDVQIIAATNRDLEREVAEGLFREDLYYRLNMVELKIPSLRERIEDLPEFVRFFSEKFAKRYNRNLWEPNPERLAELSEFPWPGNVRQLAHVIEQAYVLDCEPSLPTRKISDSTAPALPFTNLGRLREVAVRQALRATGGHKGRAAKLLGVHPNTMTRLLAQLSSADGADTNA